MLVIAGTQRSGTSLIAKALIESGYDLGSKWFDEEAQGGYDWPAACYFFRDYLGDSSFPFDDFEWRRIETDETLIRAFLNENSDQCVCKFCYLLMNPAFVYIWHKFRPRDKFLLLRRSTRDVIASKQRLPERFRHDSPLLQQDQIQLYENVRASVRAVRLLFPRRARSLFFPKEMDLDIINFDLLALDPEVQITQEAWNRVYDPSKIHYKEAL